MIPDEPRHRRERREKREAREQAVREAEAAFRPYLNQLWAEYSAAWREKRRPVKVLVPEHFPPMCEGGLLFKLPVHKAAVAKPTVVTMR